MPREIEKTLMLPTVEDRHSPLGQIVEALRRLNETLYEKFSQPVIFTGWGSIDVGTDDPTEPAWSNVTTYSTSDLVSYGGRSWRSDQDNNLNHVPAEDAWWTLLPLRNVAMPLTHAVVSKSTGVDAEDLTLANGRPGQLLTMVLAAHGGGDGTLTPATSTGFNTIVFADVGDTATLLYIDKTVGWIIIRLGPEGDPPAIT